ncbi:MAG: trimeric intracellular cation channel family protein [Rhodospirillales bacterium]|nr:trimeric intracellular cation channel family protein [Alphaproteobacteria bacterium]MCB9986675.1 trimeric intracellular cation channel family protein [Rhodospirillales bacterium]USO06798.1 MAG: trimeric intracellular cation channel family protein [Rhodospirillales bacterium]
MDTVLTLIDYAGIAVFAVTGALVAARKKLDIVSFVLLAIATGIGGGTLRDMMLGRLPVFWVREPGYLVDCVVTGAVMFFVAQRIHAYAKWIVWGDAIGIALFTVTGTRIAQEAGAGWAVSITMGVITSIVGGIIRDLLAGEPSLILRKEIYATACVFGALTYLAVHALVPGWGVVLGMAVTFVIRAAAIHWRLQLPGYLWIDDQAAHHRRSTD